MSTTDVALNVGLLALMILTQFGERRWGARKLLLPFGLIAGAGWYFLPGAPTIGHDVALDVVGVAAGIAFGVLAALSVGVGRDRSGAVVTRAGAAYVAIWIFVIGGRLLFAYGADHLWTAWIRSFSIEHLITGADAWRTAFVLMALAMAASRSTITALRATRLAAAEPVIA